MSEPVPRRQFLFIYRPTRPAMLTQGPIDAERRAIVDHFAHLVALRQRGDLVLAGRTLDDGPTTLGVAVLHADSPEHARALADADPVVARGVMTVEVRPFRVAIP
jgi:uncharacterized protein